MKLALTKNLIFLIIAIINFGLLIQTQSFSQTQFIYLVPGQGSDYRIFDKLQLPDSYDTIHVKHLIPFKKESLNNYSKRISVQIDTIQMFSIIGVSLGGMVATELAEILNPKKVIAISSANNKEELPGRYTFMKAIPIYKMVPAILYKYGSYIAQPLFEPDRKKEKETCKDMLQAKDPVFLKRAIHMIVNWERETYASNVYHIHGTNDHTLPYRKVNSDFTVDNGSHMMMLTRPGDINPLILKILED